MRKLWVKGKSEASRLDVSGTSFELNSFESLTIWRPIVDSYFKDEKERARARAF